MPSDNIRWIHISHYVHGLNVTMTWLQTMTDSFASQVKKIVGPDRVSLNPTVLKQHGKDESHFEWVLAINPGYYEAKHPWPQINTAWYCRLAGIHGWGFLDREIMLWKGFPDHPFRYWNRIRGRSQCSQGTQRRITVMSIMSRSIGCQTVVVLNVVVSDLWKIMTAWHVMTVWRNCHFVTQWISQSWL